MKDFLYNLYQNDNFTLYLTIALIVLVVLFVIVLIFGKKDQKLEETKRLQKIELEGFKEEKEEPVKVEVTDSKELNEEVKMDAPLEEEPVIKNKEEEVEITTFEPVHEVEEIKEETTETEEITSEFTINDEPIFTAVEEDIPLNIPDFDLGDLESELDAIEDVEFNPDEINAEEAEEIPESVSEINEPQVFSSVYVNNNIEGKDNNETEKISMFAMDDEDDTIELPALKVEKEEKEETPIIKEEATGFNFDDISGETYDIK